MDKAERDYRWKLTASAHPLPSCSQAWVSLLALMFTQSLANKEQLIVTCTDMYRIGKQVQALDRRFFVREIFEYCSTNQFVYNCSLLPKERYEIGSRWASWFITPLGCLLRVFIILRLSSPNTWNNSAFWVGIFFFSLNVKLNFFCYESNVHIKIPSWLLVSCLYVKKVAGRVVCV